MFLKETGFVLLFLWRIKYKDLSAVPPLALLIDHVGEAASQLMGIIAEFRGLRIMGTSTRYIESVLKLKANRKKSAVDVPGRRKFLGFAFYIREGKTRNFVHAKSIQRFKDAPALHQRAS